ncbi:MAG: hypothetical protein GTN89_14345 [Acidobacteria bacterium]|nr:hypothetical protein [Acidobacteriota bacterium]NIM60883.1 hypothetical protein [Acidobacteriota bacterium]NIO60417.1 hypothetical protein [Acidobacteriota bacterium]NIQ31512.1 hypothetical protein [Acidobacteriota bacterium]NIQ86748.1 hypothetical protein [Acidobacteriota bacterium]
MGSRFKGTLCLILIGLLGGCAGSSRGPDTEPSAGETGRARTSEDLAWRASLLQVEDTGRFSDDLRESLAADDPDRRRAAVRSLRFVRDGSMPEALVAAFSDADPSVRAEAILSAGLAGADSTVPSILEHGDDTDGLVRAAVAVALGLLPDERGSAALLGLLDDAAENVRAAACYSVARLSGVDGLVPKLLERIDDAEPDVSAAALYAASRLSGRLDALGFAARFRIREKLVELAETRDPGVQILVAEGLYSPIAGKQADTLHSMMLATDQPEVLMAILRATSLPGAPTFVFHEVLIKHSDARVVQATINGLGRMRGESVNNMLVKFIIEDSRDWLRAEAIRALALADRRLILDVANGLSNDPRALIRAATAEALYGRQEPEVATYARRMFESEDPWVKLHAIPAMAAVEELLSDVLGELVQRSASETRTQIIRAAGYRLAMGGRSAADRADALDLVAGMWEEAAKERSPAIQLAILSAAAQAEEGVDLVRRGLEADDLGVRRRAAGLLASGFGETVTVEALPAKQASYYRDIVEWADRRHAAVITVARQGFVPGRFTVALDTVNAPMTSWQFAQLAERGYYNNRRILPYLPGLRLHSGPGADERYLDTTWRAEPVFSLFGPGTLAAAGERDALLGEWLVTLSARPNYLGRYTPFGRVVQNLAGVVANVLPIDQVVSVRVYEGNGQEPLPPLGN